MVLPGWLSTFASVGMAVSPPLVYVDQTFSIVKKKCALEFLGMWVYGLTLAAVKGFHWFLEACLRFSVRSRYLKLLRSLLIWMIHFRLLANITRLLF